MIVQIRKESKKDYSFYSFYQVFEGDSSLPETDEKFFTRYDFLGCRQTKESAIDAVNKRIPNCAIEIIE